MFVVTVLLTVISLTSLGVDSELLAVVQLFRHGQRTPVSFYTNDPYQDSSYWSNLASGQLTNEGKRQHYELGQYTRSRYGSWLPSAYNSTQFHAETTDVDRTHMSAQSNIYSLYQATGTQVWRKNLNWQPVPIHPANNSIWSSNYILSNCDYYTTLYTAAINSDEYTQIDEKYADVYSYLTTHTGDEITTWSDASSVFDPLKIEKVVGYKLPSWADQVYPEPLRTINGLWFELPTHTTEMTRLLIGPFLNELVEYLEDVAEDPTSQYKLKIYSGHDTNIATVLNAFGAFDPPYPPEFASSIYIELHLESWVNVVKVFSKDGNNVTQISVKGCNLDCPLTDFKAALSDLLIDADTRVSECSQTVVSTKVLSLTPSKFTKEDVLGKFGNLVF